MAYKAMAQRASAGVSNGDIPLKPRKYFLDNLHRGFRSWLLPYMKGRIRPQEFRPVLAFVYTDLNCNMECNYCYSRGKNIPGMTFETAIKVVDWLDSVGCKVLAYMGGEPLVRKRFIVEVTQYATQKGFFVYLPTNGLLMDPEFIDEIGKAGVAAMNLAVDVVEPKEGLPKALSRIWDNFQYLVAKEPEYGYITFFNINITQKNIEDVKELTEIAHSYGIATDYHINEPPLISYDSFEHGEDGWWITPEEFEEIDNLVDWLIEKNKAGYTMVNSIAHLEAMKRFIRNQMAPWPCRAGELSMIIRMDGTFAPCFEMYGSTEDWGNLWEGPKFFKDRLLDLKRTCSFRCLSTCNYQVYHYTKNFLYSFQWVAKHAYSHLLGVS